MSKEIQTKKHRCQLGDLDVYVDIYERDGQLWTDSLSVAEAFGKRHDNVIRTIKNLQCSDRFNALNFEDVSYMDNKGEKRPLYEMTKDGMMFLVTGFSGKKPAEVKEAYIEEFNRRGEVIKEQDTVEKRLRREMEQLVATAHNIALENERRFAHHEQRSMEIQEDMGKMDFRIERTEQKCDYMIEEIGEIKQKVTQFDDHRRKKPGKKVRNTHLEVIREIYNGACPCCLHTMIAKPFYSECGRPQDYDFISKEMNFDHWIHRGRNGMDEVWPVCKSCNQRRESGDFQQATIQRLFESYIVRLLDHIERKGYNLRPQGKQLNLPIEHRSKKKDGS